MNLRMRRKKRRIVGGRGDENYTNTLLMLPMCEILKRNITTINIYTFVK